MTEENISKEFRLRKIDEKRKYFIEKKKKKNELIRKKHKKINFFCVIIVRIKKFKSIIKKNKRKHDKIVLLAKAKLNTVEVLISKAMIYSNINHDEVLLVNIVLKEYDEMKAEIKNSNKK